MIRTWCFVLCLMIGFPIMVSMDVESAWGRAFDPQRADFSVQFGEEEISYRIFGVYVMPKESVKIKALSKRRNARFTLTDRGAGKIRRTGSDKWIWKAPSEPGAYSIKLKETRTGSTMQLNVFVQVPYECMVDGCVEGYRVGEYPEKPYKNKSIYQKPRGFVKVTEENLHTLVAPHFKLEQFLCKQQSAYPKYVILKERLLLKLEYLLEQVNQRGYKASSFHVMSGYRTPAYNKNIGNVQYSRHLWGDAADIFIDENPRDGVMDDLNRDGKHDFRDSQVLYELVDGLFSESGYQPFVGGLGAYGLTKSHGPFVHVDIRGYRARWGNTPKVAQK